MDKLPPDMIYVLALSLDLPELLTYCRISKKFNRLVCANDNYWYDRLQEDYDIEKRDGYQVTLFVSEDIPDEPGYKRSVRKRVMYGPKQYYRYITDFLRDPAPNTRPEYKRSALVYAGIGNNLDKVKAAIYTGDDINTIIDGRHILYYPTRMGNLEMVKYIINRRDFDPTIVPNLHITDIEDIDYIPIINDPSDPRYNVPVIEYLKEKKLWR